MKLATAKKIVSLYQEKAKIDFKLKRLCGNGNGRAVAVAAAPEPKKSNNRVLQGRYLGAVRHLTVKQRAKVKKAKAAHGFTAALKLAKSFAKQA